MEKHYALLKNNRVMNIIVVEEQNDSEIQNFINEHDYDEFIYLGEEKSISIYSLRVGNDFLPADRDYLKSIGLSNMNNVEYSEWLIQQENLNQ